MGIRPDPERRRSAHRMLAVLAALAMLLSAAPASVTAAGPVKTNVVSVASMYDGDPDLSSFAALMGYCAKAAGTTPAIHPYPNSDFNTYIEEYLGSPSETLVTWFGGYRMQYYAAKGLLTPIDDVWRTIGGNYSAPMKALSTGGDGHRNLVPLYDYPWAVLYRKSVFAEHGYQVPTTWSQLVALAGQMQHDGLVPIAFADGAGWEALGLFDILDLRLNGYDFHEGLLNGTESWTDARVVDVFEHLRQLLPYTSADPLNRYWWDNSFDLSDGTAGMDFFGTFATGAIDPALLGDVDIFPFPTLGTAYDAEMAIDAPADGLMVSTNLANIARAKKVLACAGTAPAQLRLTSLNPGDIAAVRNASTATYSPLQKRMAAVIGGAKKVAQFLDRDTRPDFANWFYGSFQGFLADPDQGLDGYLAGIQDYWDNLGQP